MTDQSLLLLENITYLNNTVAQHAGVSIPNGIPSNSTVGEYLKIFDEEALRELENYDGDLPACMTGKEWAATIRALQGDPDLTALRCQDYSSTNFATCFTDPNGKAYVVFQGTANGEEWNDNVQGLYTEDTPRQKEALDYIESLPYNDITVVGHSKGANKAMYVTITSNKVSHCVAMDGQGFSQEYLDKYHVEIEAKGKLITNYSLDTDYVHILLFPVPGSTQLYFANGGEGGARNHCPVAYYQFFQDKDGTWRILTDKDGNPVMKAVKCENKGMEYLHDFTCFALNVMPEEKREVVAKYLGNLLGLVMGESTYTVNVGEVTYGKDDLMQYILSDQESLSTVLAYVLKYADTVGLSSSEIEALLSAFGFGELLAAIKTAINIYASKHPGEAAIIALAGAKIEDLLQFFLDQIRDGKRDPIIEKLLSWLSNWLNEKYNVNLDLVQDWRKIEEEYTAIGDVNAKAAVANGTVATSRIFNYSIEGYSKLMQTINAINRQTTGSVRGWTSYSSEEWYSKLHVSAAIKGVNGYYSYLAQINEDCSRQIERIYENVRSIDKSKASDLRACTEVICNAASDLDSIASRIG